MEKEIEIKLRLRNRKQIVSKLKHLGAIKNKRYLQKTYSAFRPDLSCCRDGFFMRTRIDDGVHTFTVKVRKENNDYFERDEYTVQIEDAETMAKMLAIIGFSRQKMLEKFRESWNLNGVKIALDSLPKLGEFIEIESSPDKIEETIKDLGLENEKRYAVAYWKIYEEETGDMNGNLLF